jgi:bacterioferritin-associated ferredoxin
MYVCVCRAVTDETVRKAIDAGADTVGAVTARTCAGDDCGACHDLIEDMIEARCAKADANGRRCLPVVRAA